MSCYHFSVFCTIVLPLTSIFVVFYQNQYDQEMVRRHREQVDWRKVDVDLMALYASGARGKETWTVSRWFYSNPLSL
jgi:hypothetical protein